MAGYPKTQAACKAAYSTAAARARCVKWVKAKKLLSSRVKAKGGRLSALPEEHVRLGKAALREVMRLEGKVRVATQAGDCAGATRASHDLFFAMGQADAHGELTNAMFARLQNMGRASVGNACGFGAQVNGLGRAGGRRKQRRTR